MHSEPGAAGRSTDTDPAGTWINKWRRLIPPPRVGWRKSAFDLARARRKNRLRTWRWLTEPVSTFQIWFATGRLAPAVRDRWEPARRGRRRGRPAAVSPRPPPAASRCVLRRPGDGHRRCRVRQDADHGGAGGLRCPPPRHAARGGRLHHLHEQGRQGDTATNAQTPAGPADWHDPPARAPGPKADRWPHGPALADGGGREPEAPTDRRLDPRGDQARPGARRRHRTAPERTVRRRKGRRTDRTPPHSARRPPGEVVRRVHDRNPAAHRRHALRLRKRRSRSRPGRPGTRRTCGTTGPTSTCRTTRRHR